MISLLRTCTGVLILSVTLPACQQLGPTTNSAETDGQTAAAPIEVAATSDGPDWSRTDDCLGKLGLLHGALNRGQIADLEATPFVLIDDRSTARQAPWSMLPGAIDPEDGARMAASEARCVIRVGEAIDRRSEHRVLGREQVRSRYKSGTRSEKNPAYDVAKARLRQAEKAAKPGKSSIIKVGDPLIDLVGTLVGGALTGFGQWGAGDQLEEALDTLMATPASIERPTYKSYHFEQTRLRAKREATLPAILTDRRLQRSWKTTIRRRQVQDLLVTEGLDPQDEHYARHRAEKLTEDGLRRWLAEPPDLPLGDLVAALLDRPEAASFDRLAMERGDRLRDAAGVLPDDMSLDAAIMPPRSRTSATTLASPAVDSDPVTDHGSTSRVEVIGEAGRADAVYVAPHFILSPSDVVAGRGLVDVRSTHGSLALGLVAVVDEGLGLALIQVPSKGEPLPIGSGGRVAAAYAMESAGAKGGETGRSGPIVERGRIAGFKMAIGPDIDSDSIRAFLDRQRHLLPTGIGQEAATASETRARF